MCIRDSVELGGITDLNRRELGGVCILELDDGQVTRSIVAHELGLVGGAVVRGHHVLVVTCLLYTSRCV